MIYKNAKAPKEVITRSVNTLEKLTGNIYETINLLAKRSNQINAQIKMELSQKFEEFDALQVDTLDEIFENKEQIEISRHYERLAKPTALAIEEYETGQLRFIYKNQEGVVEE